MASPEESAKKHADELLSLSKDQLLTQLGQYAQALKKNSDLQNQLSSGEVEFRQFLRLPRDPEIQEASKSWGETFLEEWEKSAYDQVCGSDEEIRKKLLAEMNISKATLLTSITLLLTPIVGWAAVWIAPLALTFLDAGYKTGCKAWAQRLGLEFKG